MSETLAVIIPVHNGAPFLRECLAALRAQRGCAVLPIAVDNGSRDGGAAIIAEHAEVRLLSYAEPLGFAGACNAGLREAEQLRPAPAAYALLNQDSAPDPGWAAALLAALAADPRLGVAGSLAHLPDGATQHAGAELDRPRWYGRNLAEVGARGGRPFMSFLGVAIRPQALAQVGLLDERFAAGYYEDADYCLRAEAAGWRVALAPGATLLHHEGARGRQDERHQALLERNRLRVLLKHCPLDELLDVALPAERAAMLAGGPQGDRALLRQAYTHALLQLPEIVAGRGLGAEQAAALAAALEDLRRVAAQPAPGPADEDDPYLAENLQHIRRNWSVDPRRPPAGSGQPERVARRLTGWYTLPLWQQVSAFHAALVRVVDVLAEHQRRITRRVERLESGASQLDLQVLEEQLRDLRAEQQRLRERIAELERGEGETRRGGD